MSDNSEFFERAEFIHAADQARTKATRQHLHVMGVSTMFDNPRAVLVHFNAKLSNDELREVHDYLRKWGPALSEAELEAECARIQAMSGPEIEAHIREQGDDPDEVVRRQDILIRNAIEITRLRTLAEDRLAALKRLEWSGSKGFEECSWCGEYKTEGHAAHCALLKAIARTD